MEEVIFQRQIQKNNLAGVAVNGDNLASSFTKEELRDCLTLKETVCDTKSKIGQGWPDYTGTSSLQALNQFDAPLFHMAQANSSKLLGYVRFLHESDDGMKVTAPANASLDPGIQEANEPYCSSDEDSECEF